MLKKNWIYFLFAFAVLLFVYTQFIRKKPTEDREGKVLVTIKTVHTSAGWGYEVYRNDTLSIVQHTIPAIGGNKGFVSEEQAKAVANLALQKLKAGHFPTIEIRELDSIGITR